MKWYKVSIIARDRLSGRESNANIELGKDSSRYAHYYEQKETFVFKGEKFKTRTEVRFVKADFDKEFKVCIPDIQSDQYRLETLPMIFGPGNLSSGSHKN